jgi:hypothetical protein
MPGVAVGQFGDELLLDGTGEPLLLTAVSVYNADGVTLSTLYSDLTGTSTVANPGQTTSATGNFRMFAVPGQYVLKIAGVTVATIYIPATTWNGGTVTGASTFLANIQSDTVEKHDFTNPRWGGISGSDWSPAIAAVLTAMSTNPFILTAPPTAAGYNISQNHVFGTSQGIQGSASGNIFGSPGLRFVCTAAGAGITIGGVGATCSGFTVDGNLIATTPFYIGTGTNVCVARTFIDVNVINSAQDNWTILYAQNCIFVGCSSSDPTRDGVYISGGSGTHAFYRFESNCSVSTRGRHLLNIDCAVDGTSVVGFAYPLEITFHKCWLERQTTGGTGSALRMANGGSSIGPQHCVFENCFMGLGVDATGAAADISGNSTPHFNDCEFTASRAGGLKISDNCHVFLSYPQFIGVVVGAAAPWAISLAAASYTDIVGMLFVGSGFTTTFGGVGAADGLLRSRLNQPLEITRNASGDTVATWGYTPGTGIAVVEFANGTRWWYSGYTPDTNLGWAGGAGGLSTNKGIGFWGHAVPSAQPAAPVTLADVIAVLRGCGLTA